MERSNFIVVSEVEGGAALVDPGSAPAFCLDGLVGELGEGTTSRFVSLAEFYDRAAPKVSIDGRDVAIDEDLPPYPRPLVEHLLANDPLYQAVKLALERIKSASDEQIFAIEESWPDLFADTTPALPKPR